MRPSKYEGSQKAELGKTVVQKFFKEEEKPLPKVAKS